MDDQASPLRHLMLRSANRWEVAPSCAPCLVAITGGAIGVGTTSTTLELGAALVELGLRVVMVDVDPRQPGLAKMCEPELTDSAERVLGHRDIHAALARGPRGIQVVPRVWESYPARQPERIIPALLRQFPKLGRHADVILLDCGVIAKEQAKLWSDAVNLRVFVTSTMASAVTRTYTLLKQWQSTPCHGPAHLLVRGAATVAEAEEVIFRFERSCRRFLHTTLGGAHYDAGGLEQSSAIAQIADACVNAITQQRRAPSEMVA